MAYVTEISNSLAETLKKLATLNRHQLSGHVANLSFWISEVRHGLDVIDGYRDRFDAMKAAQVKHAVEHHSAEFALDQQYDLGNPPAPPRPIPHSQLNDARRALCDAFYAFVVRCHNGALLDRAGAQSAAASIGVSIDPKDLKD